MTNNMLFLCNIKQFLLESNLVWLIVKFIDFHSLIC